MIQSSQYSTSIDPHLRKIRPFLAKNPKHIRTVKQFYDYEDVPEALVSRLFKKLKTAKTLRSLSLQPPTFDIKIKPEIIQSILKVHSQELKVLDASTYNCLFSNSYKSPIFSMKNLCRLNMSNKPNTMRALRSLRTLKSLALNLQCSDIQINRIYPSLLRLRNIKNIAVLPSPSALKKALELLNEFSAKRRLSVNFQIFTKDNEQYSDKLPSLHVPLSKMITKIYMQHIKETYVLESLSRKPALSFPKLKSLKLEFSGSDLRLISYLKYLKHTNVLEKLSLRFAECHSKEFSRQLMRDIQLPNSLKSLNISVSVSFQNMMTKNRDFLNTKEEKYAWRHVNIFEDEPLFLSFFETLEEATSLKKIQFEFQMLESFNSHFTNFFVSILNRLHSIQCFSFSIIDYHGEQDQGRGIQISEGFDLSLLLKSCSNLDFLENIEVAMPNFLFEDAKLNTNLRRLKGFSLGVSQQEEDTPIKFRNISQYITGFIKTLALNALNLNTLILDFGEEIDGRTFDKRFVLLQNLQNLEFLCMKLFVQRCSPNQARSVGKALQSLQKLDALSLRFSESDENIRQLSIYLKYHKSFREALMIVNDSDWVGDEEFVSFRENPEGVQDDFDEIWSNDDASENPENAFDENFEA